MSNLDSTVPLQAPSLKNKRILIVEDEYLVADEMAQDFASVGAMVVGPVPIFPAADSVLEPELSTLILNLPLDKRLPRGPLLHELKTMYQA